MRRLFMTALVGITGTVAACASLEGLSGPPADAGSQDAGLDTATEAGGGDANGGPDAALPDAYSGPDASWCARQQGLQFCADFDEYNVELGWGGAPFLQGDASIAQDDAASTSAPFSALVDIPAMTAGKARASLDKTFQVSPSKVHVAFDVRFDQIDPTTTSEYLASEVSLGQNMNGGLYIYLDIAPAGPKLYIQVYDGDGGELQQTLPFSGSFTPDQWTHVDLDYTFAGANGTAAAWLNDASVLGQSSFLTGGFTEPLLIDVGGFMYAPTAQWRVRFDNVAVTYQ